MKVFASATQRLDATRAEGSQLKHVLYQACQWELQLLLFQQTGRHLLVNLEKMGFHEKLDLLAPYGN